MTAFRNQIASVETNIFSLYVAHKNFSLLQFSLPESKHS